MNKQNGSALIMLFVCLGLFGLVSYAFTQGTRSNMSLVSNVKTSAQSTKSQDCSTVLNMAVKRLNAKGCTASIISYKSDGSAVTGGPSDGSCSMYHANGGGVKDCDGTAIQAGGGPAPPSDACLTGLTAGQGCTGADGLVAVYAGVSGGNRIYAAAADLAATSWNNGSGTMPSIAGATSNTNGVTNTDAIVATVSGSPYNAAANCRALGPKWYLPSPTELNTLYTVRTTGVLNGTFTTSSGGGSRYWSSRQISASQARCIRLQDNSTDDRNKDGSYLVRCIRQD